MVTTRCPLCRTIQIVHPGLPPGPPPYDYLNRCSAPALSGKAGHNTRHYALVEDGGYFLPKRKASGTCGFPLTAQDGTVLPLPPFSWFMERTCRDFSVAALTRDVWSWIETELAGFRMGPY